MSFVQQVPMETLRGMVGQDLGHSDWYAVPQAMIDAFADLTHDHHFIHVDPQAANDTMFGGTIAHGFLTMSLLSPMSFAVVPVPDHMDHAINYGFDRLRFTGAVPSDARVRGRFKLNALKEEGASVRLYLEAVIEVEGQDRPAIIADWVIQVVRHVVP